MFVGVASHTGVFEYGGEGSLLAIRQLDDARPIALVEEIELSSLWDVEGVGRQT